MNKDVRFYIYNIVVEYGNGLVTDTVDDITLTHQDISELDTIGIRQFVERAIEEETGCIDIISYVYEMRDDDEE